MACETESFGVSVGMDGDMSSLFNTDPGVLIIYKREVISRYWLWCDNPVNIYDKIFSLDGDNQATAAGSFNFVKNLCRIRLNSPGTSIMGA